MLCASYAGAAPDRESELLATVTYVKSPSKRRFSSVHWDTEIDYVDVFFVDWR